MTKHIKTSIHIKANPQEVWEVLMDFDKYKAWNPFIKSISGNIEQGGSITVEFQGFVFKPKVLVLNENSELKWLGHLWFKGLFDGEHRFFLKDNGDGTTYFEQSEYFKGLLVGLFSHKLDTKTKKDFEDMNIKLKERVENITIREA